MTRQPAQCRRTRCYLQWSQIDFLSPCRQLHRHCRRHRVNCPMIGTTIQRLRILMGNFLSNEVGTSSSIATYAKISESTIRLKILLTFSRPKKIFCSLISKNSGYTVHCSQARKQFITFCWKTRIYWLDHTQCILIDKTQEKVTLNCSCLNLPSREL